MIQGSEQWFAARSCRITASRFGDVIANPKTKRYNNYLNELIDNLSGIPVFDDPKPWFKHGIEMEPKARRLYEWEMFKDGHDVDVEQVGIIIHPQYDFISCSPDGIWHMGKKGIEIKSRISYASHLISVKSGLPSVNKPQVQGSLWICKDHPEYMAEAWDFISYFEDPDGIIESDLSITVIEHDGDYQKKLEEACLIFWDNVKKG